MLAGVRWAPEVHERIEVGMKVRLRHGGLAVIKTGPNRCPCRTVYWTSLGYANLRHSGSSQPNDIVYIYNIDQVTVVLRAYVKILKGEQGAKTN